MLDLAIIGVPKSGTSSLYAWLADHPALQGSTPKETYYFMDPGHPLDRPVSFTRLGWEGYARFRPDGDEQRKFFEATVHHIYQQTALDAFTSLRSPPLVVAALRSPAEQIRSAFYFARHNYEQIDLGLSFNLFAAHLLAGTLSEIRGAFTTDTIFYLANRLLGYAQYAVWLDRWSERLPPGGLHLVTFDAIRSDPKSVVQEICRKLGVDERFYDAYEFVPRHRTLHYRSARLHSIMAPAVRRTGPVSTRLAHWYRRLQIIGDHDGARRVDAEGLKQLNAYFRPWNERLIATHHCDAGAWLQGTYV